MTSFFSAILLTAIKLCYGACFEAIFRFNKRKIDETKQVKCSRGVQVENVFILHSLQMIPSSDSTATDMVIAVSSTTRSRHF